VTELVEFVLVGTTAVVVIDGVTDVVTDVMTDVVIDVVTDAVADVEVIGDVLAAVTPAPGEEEHVDRLQVQE